MLFQYFTFRPSRCRLAFFEWPSALPKAPFSRHLPLNTSILLDGPVFVDLEGCRYQALQRQND